MNVLICSVQNTYVHRDEGWHLVGTEEKSQWKVIANGYGDLFGRG